MLPRKVNKLVAKIITQTTDSINRSFEDSSINSPLAAGRNLRLTLRESIMFGMQVNAQQQSLFPRIYEVVKQVPRGQVTTYGDVATIVGTGCDARLAGYAMANCPDDVPWQRVINAQGKISLRGSDGAAKQRLRLEAEGIVFDPRGRIDLPKYRWAGPSREWAAEHGFNVLPEREPPIEQQKLF